MQQTIFECGTKDDAGHYKDACEQSDYRSQKTGNGEVADDSPNVAGMSHEPVGAAVYHLLVPVVLNAYGGGEETVGVHCPGSEARSYKKQDECAHGYPGWEGC